MKYYTARSGRQPGIYTTWDACRGQVEGYKGAVFKSFTDEEEAKLRKKDIAEIEALERRATNDKGKSKIQVQDLRAGI